MKQIPLEESLVTDEEVFEAFDLQYPGLEKVRFAWEKKDLVRAKEELVRYFETRKQVHYYYDYRMLPLKKIETDENPDQFQASMGLEGSLKEFCLFAGEKMLQHIYVRPGKERKELNLGSSYENLPHFDFFKDQGKKHRTTLDIFVRGIFLEYLGILYHETGRADVIEFTEEFLRVFWKTYPLHVECTQADTSHFSLKEERDVMSAGFLAFNYVTLLYTRLPYEMKTETAFELIKHLLFLGIQFGRFEQDTYRKYNHHLWERGLVPFQLGTLFPEIPAFVRMKESGARTVRLHIMDDFNEEGGYNEHSISYWAGAALGSMLCGGIKLAKLNGESLLNEETKMRINKSYDALALICAPGERYPALGDNGEIQIPPVLKNGAEVMDNRLCRETLRYRQGKTEIPDIPLDYCCDKTGFFCTKSSLKADANYLLMSAKVRCGDTGHNHMDVLSAFVSVHGQEFIGEPYARALYHNAWVGCDLRGYMYNMQSHNTVLVFGESIQPDDRYASKWGVLRPDTPVECFAAEEKGCFVSAYHDAYTHSRHVRKILSCRSRGFLIRDEIIGGDRLAKAHIQRWHLFPDVICTQLDERRILLEKNHAKALLVFGGTPNLRIWKKEELVPLAVQDRKGLGFIIDASFETGNVTCGGRIGAVVQDLLILDVTETMPQLTNVDELCSLMIRTAEEKQLRKALDIFETAIPCASIRSLV